jgi:hypothetical protein
MSIQSVKRWQWLLISILLGLGIALAQRSSATDLPSYGEGLTDQRTFERRVLTNLAGKPMFKDIYVTRQTLDDGAGHQESVYLVSGKSVGENARAGDRYRPFCFVSRVPYHPATDLYLLGGTAVSDSAVMWGKIENPTVVDFLELAHKGHGVQYTFAWWNTYPLTIWLGGTVLLIGVILPCVIDLYYFGRLVRAREPKGVSLGNVAPSPTAAPTGASDGELAHLHELEDELEQNLRGTTAGNVSAAAEAAPVRSLAETSDSVAVPDEHDDRLFRAKPDDYYPTEDRSQSVK